MLEAKLEESFWTDLLKLIGATLSLSHLSHQMGRIGKYYEKLSNEIGFTVRQYALVRLEKWKQMPRFEINAMLD